MYLLYFQSPYLGRRYASATASEGKPAGSFSFLSFSLAWLPTGASPPWMMRMMRMMRMVRMVKMTRTMITDKDGDD